MNIGQYSPRLLFGEYSPFVMFTEREANDCFSIISTDKEDYRITDKNIKTQM